MFISTAEYELLKKGFLMAVEENLGTADLRFGFKEPGSARPLTELYINLKSGKAKLPQEFKVVLCTFSDDDRDERLYLTLDSNNPEWEPWARIQYQSWGGVAEVNMITHGVLVEGSVVDDSLDEEEYKSMTELGKKLAERLNVQFEISPDAEWENLAPEEYEPDDNDDEPGAEQWENSNRTLGGPEYLEYLEDNDGW